MQSQSSGQKKHSIDRKNGFVNIVSLHKTRGMLLLTKAKRP